MSSRRPHNNRMSTSASLKTHSIWQTAIGHDPYANTEEEKQKERDSTKDAANTAKVMELARTQNITDGAQRNDFTARMYLGLKQGKQRRRNGDNDANEKGDPKLQQLLNDPDSSSEEEFVEKPIAKSTGKSKKSRKQKRSHSSDDSSESRHRDIKRRKKRKKRNRDDDSQSSGSESSSEDERRKRKREKKRRQKRKHKDRRK